MLQEPKYGFLFHLENMSWLKYIYFKILKYKFEGKVYTYVYMCLCLDIYGYKILFETVSLRNVTIFF